MEVKVGANRFPAARKLRTSSFMCRTCKGSGCRESFPLSYDGNPEQRHVDLSLGSAEGLFILIYLNSSVRKIYLFSPMLLNHLYQYELVYFILWVVIPHCVTLLLKLSQHWPLGAPVSLTHSYPFVFEHLLTFWYYKMFQVYFVFSLPQP